MLEQMYLKTASKIFVFAPNCWETSTEFSRHNSRMWSHGVVFLRKLGHCHSEIRLVSDTLQIRYLAQLFL
jgi:hypothetical protein